MSASEASPEQNPSARSAALQGSNIPLGWKPTVKEPVPVVRCVQIKPDGTRCKRWSLRGVTKCYKHAGNGGFKNVQDRAQAVIEAARLELMETAPAAVDTLKWLMEPGTAEAIRLKAATEVLDRNGIRGGFDVKVEVEDVTQDPHKAVADRLAKLSAGAQAVRRMQSDDPAEDVVDAELVEDEAQLSIFDVLEDEVESE